MGDREVRVVEWVICDIMPLFTRSMIGLGMVPFYFLAGDINSLVKPTSQFNVDMMYH